MFLRRSKGSNQSNRTISLRTKEINELKTNFPNTKADADGSTFHLPMTTTSGIYNMTLQVSADFPQTPPIITSKENIRHRLFNSNMRLVGLREIQEWKSNSSLVGLIRSLENHLHRNPPLPIARVTSTPAPSYVNNTNTNGFVQPLHRPTPQFQNPNYHQPTTLHHHQPRSQPTAFNKTQHAQPATSSYTPPKPDFRFQILDAYNTDELQNLVDSEAQIETLVESSGIFKSGDDKKKQLYEGVEKIASDNMKMKPEIEGLQREIKELRTIEKEKRANVTKLIDDQQRILKNFSIGALRSQLSEAVSKVEESSEEIVQKFNDEEMDLTQFLRTYIKARTLFHQRAAKQERMNLLH